METNRFRPRLPCDRPLAGTPIGKRVSRRLPSVLLALAAIPLAAAEVQGPLRVHPANPRYFTDGSGKAILLTGSHTWGNLQDYTYDVLPSPPAMDFDAYLAFLKRHNHNFFRLWAWESSFNPNAKQGTIRYDPMPYQRPGPWHWPWTASPSST